MSDHSPTGAPGDHSDALIRANRKTLTGVLMGDPSTVLSVLTGVVAVCGLLNQVFFYWFFDITYIAYVGASDFLALILKTIPFTLLVVLIALVASGLAALGVIYSQSGVLAWFWRLGIALSLACRLTLSRTCGLLAGVAAWLIRLVRQYQTAWPPERVDRITAIAEAAQALSDLCRDYEPVCQRRAAESCRKRQQVFEKRRHSLRRLRDFANQSYFETFVSMTILMLLMGFVLSGLAGYRLETKLQYPEKQGEFWRPFDPVFAVLFPGFGPEVSVNLDSLRPALNGTVFLGGTSEYGFFLRHPDLTPLVVPTREIELVAIASQVPEGLRKPEEDTEVLIAEQIGRVADSVSSVSNSLDRTSDGLVALGAGLLDRLVVPASLSADCRDNLIKGVDFRFAHGDFDPLASATLAGPTTAISVDEYHVAVAQYNAVQRARLVDYVTTTPFGYRPGDYLLVEGHASGEGTFAYNEELAEARATEITRYLSAAQIWNHVEAFSRPDVIDVALVWQSPEQIRQSFRAVGRGEHAWQNDPEDPRNRRVLVYHCRPQPRPLRDEQARQASSTAAIPAG